MLPQVGEATIEAAESTKAAQKRAALFCAPQAGSLTKKAGYSGKQENQLKHRIREIYGQKDRRGGKI